MKRSAFVVIALALLALPIAAQKPPDRPHSQVQLVEATIDQLQHALRTGLLTSEQLVEMYQARSARGGTSHRRPAASWPQDESAVRHPDTSQGQHRYLGHAHDGGIGIVDGLHSAK